MTISKTTRRLLAVAIVLQPLLVGLNALFHPAIEFTASGILAGAAESATTWYAVHMIAALGALLTIPAVLGLRTLVRERGRPVANIGVGAGIFAGAILGIAFGIEASVMRLAVSSGLDRPSALALSETLMGSPESFAVPVGVVAFVLGGILLAAALLAGRVVPRWQAGLYLIGTLATLAGAPGSPLGPIAFAIVTVAAVFLAGHVTRGDAEPSLVPAEVDILVEARTRRPS